MVIVISWIRSTRSTRSTRRRRRLHRLPGIRFFYGSFDSITKKDTQSYLFRKNFQKNFLQLIISLFMTLNTSHEGSQNGSRLKDDNIASRSVLSSWPIKDDFVRRPVFPSFSCPQCLSCRHSPHSQWYPFSMFSWSTSIFLRPLIAASFLSIQDQIFRWRPGGRRIGHSPFRGRG